jgi:MFS family permease
MIGRSAAGLALAAFLGGLFENGTHTAGTLIALSEGWSGRSAVSLAGVMAAGSYFIQRPLGRLADRRGSSGIVRWALVVLAVSLFALPWAAGRPWLLWALALIWGSASGSLYTLAMTGTAQQLPSRQIAAATTVMVLGYTVGSALGPILGGLAVDAASLKGVAGIFGTLAALGWGASYLSTPKSGRPSASRSKDRG